MPSQREIDEGFMRRAIRLAMNGRGRVEPNPMVGCVIVSRDGRVIGEGWHRRYGQAHAEPNALAACTESPAGATAYVTLEPCCHTNKQTPPCAPRLIEAEVARVVVGCLDPNPAVDGAGVARIRAAGIEVDVGVLEAACKQLIAPFIARVVHKRPYVTLKWAQTADGKVAGPGGRRMHISNEQSMRAVHELRARCDAILVGVNTVINDDPLLTARGVEAARPSVRCVVDSSLRTPADCMLVRSAREQPVMVFTADATLEKSPERVAALREAGVEVIGLPAGDQDGRPSLGAALAHLRDRGVAHLLVEPGPTLAASFPVRDRLWVFRSPNDSRDGQALAAPTVAGEFIPVGTFGLEGDVLTEYLNERSAVFFDGTQASADLALAARGTPR